MAFTICITDCSEFTMKQKKTKIVAGSNSSQGGALSFSPGQSPPFPYGSRRLCVYLQIPTMTKMQNKVQKSINT